MCRSSSVSFPCIRGTQATMDYYVCMVPLHQLSSLFIFSDADLPSNMRSQRVINKSRIPEMKEYILQNRESYVFSALTASIDGAIEFTPMNEDPAFRQMGTIKIPMNTKILINDGQHRKAAIEAALKECPALRYEEIAVVIYPDIGLKRSQQMFSDLNRYAVRPTKSLNILYDQRDAFSRMICSMVDKLSIFGDLVDREHASLSPRSKALYTLSGLYSASECLFRNVPDEKKTQSTLEDFWWSVYNNLPDWQLVAHGEMKAAFLRQEKLTGHVVLQKALGYVGNTLLLSGGSFHSLSILKEIDWDKENPVWKGHAVVNGRISGVDNSARYIADYILQQIQGKEEYSHEPEQSDKAGY